MNKKLFFRGSYMQSPQIKHFFRIAKMASLCLILFACCLNAENLLLLDAKIVFKKSSSSLEQIMEEIETQSQYLFVYTKDVNIQQEYAVDMKPASLQETLDKLFAGTEVHYDVEGSYIILSAGRNMPEKFAATAVAQQEDRRVAGSVVDEKGEPVAGANVVERGTTNGVITDMDGKFEFSVSSGAVLRISFVGYLSQDVAVGNQTNFRIMLYEDSRLLEEVVVIGYGTVKKSDLTGSVSPISAREFSAQPVKNLSSILQGRAAGVQATSYSGIIGSEPSIRIRGVTSINTGNDPIWVVDGVIGGGVTNMADVESIEILKDASSTAIYGSRGANGVILVTTKRGQAGKSRVEFSSETGISNIVKRYDLMNAYEYAQALQELGGTVFSDADMEAYRNGTKGIDWQDLLTQTGITQDYKLSISGGNQTNKYMISGLVLDQTGYTIESKSQRYGVRANLDSQVTPWLNIVSNFDVSKAFTHNLDVSFGEMLIYSPTMELQDENGVFLKDPYNSISSNPYNRTVIDNDNDTYLTRGYIDLRFKIAEGLTLSVQGSASFNHSTGYYFASAKRGPSDESSMSNSANRTFGWQVTDNLTYRKTFGNHHLTATAVFEAYKSEWSYVGASGNNLLSEKVGYWSVGSTQTARTGNNGYSAEQMVSTFGRLMYNYKGRYYLTATIRGDGASKFQNNKWGYFPSGAASWNIAEEDFMSGQEIFRQLKLRTSIGVTGNQGIGSYSTLGNLTRAEYAYGTGQLYTGFWQQSFASPDLKWEKTIQYDAGLDVSVLDRQLNFTVDWYKKDTRDLLFAKPVPAFKGGGSYWANVGALENSGWEFAVNSFLTKNNDFEWESTFNATYLKTKVINLGGEKRIIPDQISRGGGLIPSMYVMEPGLPVSNFRLYKWVGFDDKGANLFATADGGTTTNPQDDDRIITGNPFPEWSFGWNNAFRYKYWEANIFFRASTGFQRMNMNRYATTAMFAQSRFINLRDAYYKGWDKVADKADALYPSYKNTENRFLGASTQWLEDADFLKIQNVSLSYLIPRKLAKIADIRLSAAVQNLLTLSGYSGMDPEASNNISGDREVGLDHGAFPLPRTYTFTVKFDF
jgi:TonB-linked SusC/RagA family outer membrane protein